MKQNKSSEFNKNTREFPQDLSSQDEISSTMNMNEIISLAWGAKELLRGDYKRASMVTSSYHL